MKINRVVLGCVAKSELAAEDGNPCRIAHDRSVSKRLGGKRKEDCRKRKDRKQNRNPLRNSDQTYFCAHVSSPHNIVYTNSFSNIFHCLIVFENEPYI